MDLFKPASSKGKQAATFQDSTLILPIVSLANVAQLAADLLIHSLELESVGCLKGKYHIPLVAPGDYVEEAPKDGGLCTAIEVFQSKDGSLTLVQQRSPVIKSRKDDFVEALVAFIRAASFKRVLVAAGMDAGLMQHYDNPSPFRSLSPASTSFQPSLETVMKPLDSSSTLTASTVPLIPSSGITRRLLTSLLSSSSPDNSLDFAVALMFVAEGDNRYDAHVFARCIDKILGLQTVEEKWREPISWKVGLYGQDLDRGSRGTAELYG